MRAIDKARNVGIDYARIHTGTNEPSWVIDAETFRQIMEDARLEHVIRLGRYANTLLGIPYRVIFTEPLEPYVYKESVPTEVAEPMPVLLAIEYRDDHGLTRYVFSDGTDERFKA